MAAALKVVELEKITTGVVIIDKYGTQWFKTSDDLWCSDFFEFSTSKEISKKLPKIDKYASIMGKIRNN